MQVSPRQLATDTAVGENHRKPQNVTNEDILQEKGAR